MIRRIRSITGFGVYGSFAWPSQLPDFSRYNLIYGWNYSGKTTLSRAFRCFEKGERHLDFSSAEVELVGNDGISHRLSSPAGCPHFRTFNSDFIRDNLKFEEGDAVPVLILGEADIEKEELLAAKRKRKGDLEQLHATEKVRKATLKAELDKALTAAARDQIKTALNKPSYDKTRLEPKIISCKNEPHVHLLDDEALQSHQSVYRAGDNKPKLSAVPNSLSSLAELASRTENTLARVVTASQPISRLKDNSALEAWVRQGIPLHDDAATCQFCERSLPEDWLSRLQAHFSADYDDLMGELSALSIRLAEAAAESITLPHKSELFPELSDGYARAADKIAELLKLRAQAFRTLEGSVVEKEKRAFAEVPCPQIEDNSAAFDAALLEANGLIERHNGRSDQFEEGRKASFEKIELHVAARFVQENDYQKRLEELDGFAGAATARDTEMRALNANIRSLEEDLSEASRGAERINALLATYFGKRDLEISVGEEKRFQIRRGTALARNLSEGEKTAIAFAYFIASVQDGKVPLSETRIFIDDPISSLDANHLFNTYALIKTQLAECCQLFVSTHSFEFFNLMREWAADDEGPDRLRKQPQSSWKKWRMLLVRRLDDGNAAIEELPELLLRYKSEYHYLFSVLWQFDQQPENFETLMSLPNVVRRFMEAFGGIMIPVSGGLKAKMPRLFPNDIQRERVWKFLNHYSHNQTIIRSLTIPDLSECREVVQACLSAVEKWDDEYYRDLLAEVA